MLDMHVTTLSHFSSGFTGVAHVRCDDDMQVQMRTRAHYVYAKCDMFARRDQSYVAD